jgi:hypothetical protein
MRKSALLGILLTGVLLAQHALTQQPAPAKKPASPAPAFVPLPKDIQCSLQGVSFMSVVGAHGQMENTNGKVESVSCWIVARGEDQKKDIPLASNEITHDIITTKDFGRLKMTPENSVISAGSSLSIRSDKIKPLRAFLLGQAAPTSNESTQTSTKSTPVVSPSPDAASQLPLIVSKVSEQDDYKTLDVLSLVKAYDGTHNIEALAPLERQAVLDVLLRRVVLTRKAAFRFPQINVSESGDHYLVEGKGGLTASGTASGVAPDGHKYQFNSKGVIVLGNGNIMSVGTGQYLISATGISEHALSGGKGSFTIASAGNGLWLVSAEMPRDRIIIGPFGVGGMGDVVFPTGDGTIYGIRGEIKDFFPGLTVHTEGGKTAYFALIANFGVSYLAGDVTIWSDDHPEKKTILSAH